jgi:aldose sugar dehydrogenase
MLLNRLSILFFLIISLSIFTSCKDDRILLPKEDVITWPDDSTRVVKDGLNFPWEILWGKDDYIWATERNGKIYRINPLNGSTKQIASIGQGFASQGEGGLLGMVQDPDFVNNGYIYYFNNYRVGTVYKGRVQRAIYDKELDALTAPRVLLADIPAATTHNGSRLLITPDNKLLVTTGDAEVPANAQSNTSLSGKVLRMNLDGTIPTDNPDPTKYIWSRGHRNPQGLVYINGKVYTSEHGANIEDEINIIEAGRNYGWPNVEGVCNGGETSFCTTNNIKQPAFSSGNVTLAYSSLDYYTGDRISGFKNKLLLATLKNQSLEVFTLNNDGTISGMPVSYFKDKYGRIRDICVSPEGRVYICTSNGGGTDKIIEIQKL